MHKRLNSVLLRATLVCLSLVLSGCASTYHVRWYDGPPRATNEVALVKVQFEFMGEVAQVKSIDGTPHGTGKLRGGYPHELELPAGEHTIGVGYYAGMAESTSAIKLTFTCQAGHVYELHVARINEGFSNTVGVALGGSGHYTAWIIDSDTKEVLAGKPRTEPYHWYEK
jgi:hypothetical protein